MDFGKLIAPYARRISNMLARGTVVMANASNKMQRLQLKLLAGELADNVEHFEPYGYTSHPKPGAEHLTVFLDGDRGHGITVVVADKRYRLTGLAEGEVAMYTDEGDSIQMKRGRNITVNAGTKITATAPNVEIVASVKVTLTTPLVEATQDVRIDGKLDVTGIITGLAAINATGNIASSTGNVIDSSGKSMAASRTVYNGHTHVENNLPGSTNTPTQPM